MVSNFVALFCRGNTWHTNQNGADLHHSSSRGIAEHVMELVPAIRVANSSNAINAVHRDETTHSAPPGPAKIRSDLIGDPKPLNVYMT